MLNTKLKGRKIKLLRENLISTPPDLTGVYVMK